MLFELHLEFEDGSAKTTIVTAEETKIYPQRDGIVNSGCKPFKYHVQKHSYLPCSIVRFTNSTMIFPAGIECHPQTTLEDIVEIKSQEQIQEETPIVPQPEKLKSWKFESASGGGTYMVKQTKEGTLRCDCMGYFRSRDRRCKHIKEVETY